MKRQKLIKYIEKKGCYMLREGKRHTIYKNPDNGNQSSIGRHKELSDLLCVKVCKQLGINSIKNK